jgi:hypothetical protein
MPVGTISRSLSAEAKSLEVGMIYLQIYTINSSSAHLMSLGDTTNCRLLPSFIDICNITSPPDAFPQRHGLHHIQQRKARSKRSSHRPYFCTLY